ncbi:MAG: bifunctional 4-hydroxy-2-oxoglutarate aldolase/2-dehydro-3-deoxy-phosphogluconate aldolase [Candidatus Limnocylindria bacterium]
MGRTPDVPIPAELEGSRIVAIMRRLDLDVAARLVEAMARGGIRVVEVTWDSPAARETLRHIRDRSPELLLGAGTVMTLEQAEESIESGARFIVSPHTDPDLIGAMSARGVLCIPGAQTATEIVTAARAGAAIVKVFPARALGPEGLQDLLGPLRGTRLLPTGGIDLASAAEFVAAGAWGLGIGSVVTGLAGAGRFDEVTEQCRAFAAIAAGARERG